MLDSWVYFSLLTLHSKSPEFYCATLVINIHRIWNHPAQGNGQKLAKKGSFGPKVPLLVALEVLGGHGGPDLVTTVTGCSACVGLMVITHFGLILGLFCMVWYVIWFYCMVLRWILFHSIELQCIAWHFIVLYRMAWYCIVFDIIAVYCMSPHCVEESPAGVACNPWVAWVKVATITSSPTDGQPPPRQEGEAVALPWLRQIRDGAGVGGREQLHTW